VRHAVAAAAAALVTDVDAARDVATLLMSLVGRWEMPLSACRRRYYTIATPAA